MTRCEDNRWDPNLPRLDLRGTEIRCSKESVAFPSDDDQKGRKGSSSCPSSQREKTIEHR